MRVTIFLRQFSSVFTVLKIVTKKLGLMLLKKYLKNRIFIKTLLLVTKIRNHGLNMSIENVKVPIVPQRNRNVNVVFKEVL